MPEIVNVALVCPPEFDNGFHGFTECGYAQVTAASIKLRIAGRFVDPVVLHADGLESDAATADFLGRKLAIDEYYTPYSRLINQLNENPALWLTGGIRSSLEDTIARINPPIEHRGNVVAVVSPRAIAAIMELAQVSKITPDKVYFPVLK